MINTDSLFQFIFNQGVLGVMLLLAIVVIVILYKRVEYLESARVTDAKEITDTVKQPLSDINRTMTAILALLTKGQAV